MTPKNLNWNQLSEIGDERRRGSENWMTSFADIVTVLLCFFILFFSVSQSHPDSEDEKSAIIKEMVSAFSTGKGSAIAACSSGTQCNESSPDFSKSTKAQQNDSVSSASSNLLPSQIRTVFAKNLPGVTIVGNEADLVVDFADATFFGEGDISLNRIGLVQIQKVIATLNQYKGKILITIRGHADLIPFSKSKFKNRFGKSFEPNTELSAYRALTVRDYFLKAGWESDDILITGLGHGGRSEKQNGKATRRVSFKLEPKS